LEHYKQPCDELMELHQSTAKLQESNKNLINWQKAQNGSLQEMRKDLQRLREELNNRFLEANKKIDRILFWIFGVLISALFTLCSELLLK